MLKILRKIAAGNYDFTPNELRVIAPRYFRYFAEQRQPEMLEKLLPYLPEADHEKQLSHYALRGLYYGVENGPDETGTLKYILQKAEEIGVSQEFWDDLVKDEEMFSYVVASGSEENVDLLLEYYNRYGGRETVLEQLPSGGFGLIHIHMIDKLIKLCQDWGGDELVKEMIRCSELSVERIVDGRLAPPADEQAKTEAALYLLRKQNELGGVPTVVKSIEHLYENADEDYLEKKRAIIVPIFQSLMQIGGNELVKAVFSLNDHGIGRHFAYEGAQPITDEIDDLAVQTQDQDFIESVRDEIFRGWYGSAKLVNWAGNVLDEDHSDKTEDDKNNDLDFAWQLLAKEHEIPSREIDKQDLRREVVQAVMASGNHEQLKKLSDLHEAYGRSSLFPMALSHFELMARENPSVPMIDQLLEYTLQNYGYEYVEDFLTSPIRKVQDVSIEPTSVVVAKNKLEDVKSFFDLAERMGGQSLIDRLIAGQDKLYLPLIICHGTQRGDILDHMLQRLSPEAQERAYDILPDEWRMLAERKIPKHQFFLSQTSGQARWLAVTGKPAPSPSFIRMTDDSPMTANLYGQLERLSPYRFKNKLYEQILPVVEFAAGTEGFTCPEVSAVVYAYKLATLFSSEEEIEAYLHKFATTWGKDSKNLLHDACLFELPEHGSWNPKKWQRLVTAYGPQVFPMLKSAAGLEEIMGDDPFPKTIEELNTVVLKIKYKRKYEDPRLAELSAQCALLEEDFDYLLNFVAEHGKSQDFLPAVRIDGADLGFPDMYMERLPPDDPLGFFLGHVSNSCQSINGNGQDCVLYGMSSPYSGFYVWRTKTDGIITEIDPIVAQSWVWIGSDNALVFDSFERTKPAYNEIVRPFLEQFAHEVIGKHEFEDYGTQYISGVRLGCDASGQTPPLSLQKIPDPRGPRDYEGKYSDGTDARDSKEQYVIKPVDYRLSAQPKLPPPQFSDEADKAGMKYISSVERKIRERYGVDIKLAIELEFYAVGTDNKLAAEIPCLEQLQGDMKAAGLDFRILQGDPDTRCGQHRIVSAHGSPIQIVKSANSARKFLKENAKKYDLAVLSFLPRPYKGHEWSSASIYASLNGVQGQSRLTDGAGNLSVFGEDVIASLISFNRHAFLSYAQQDIDYARYWNSDFAPSAIAFGEDYRSGFRIAHSAERGGLIENRLANANCNLVSSVAATLAGVEYALASAQPTVSQAADIARAASYPIPATRYEALMAMKEGINSGLFKGAASEVFKAIARQHEVSAQRPAPAGQQPGQLVPQ